MGLAILLNALNIGLETAKVAQDPGLPQPAHETIYLLFNLLFVVELFVRILAHGPSYFYNDDWRWNWLDTALVISSTADWIVVLLGAKVLSSGRSLRVLRLLRLARTIRVVRALRATREFQKMFYALMCSMRTLLCSLLILFLMIYFFGIAFCQGSAEYRQDERAAEIPDLLEFYGTLPKTFNTLFMSVASGVSWYGVWLPISSVHWTYGAGFLLYIGAVLFGVLNVVTSVFVESAIMSAQRDKDLITEEKQHAREIAVRHMKNIFKEMDEDGSGEITSEEMEGFLMDPGLLKYVEALDISAESTRMLFRLLDRDGSKKIDIEEFCEGCLRLQGEAKSIDVHTMIYQMRQFLVKWSDFTVYVEDKFVDVNSRLTRVSAGLASTALH